MKAVLERAELLRADRNQRRGSALASGQQPIDLILLDIMMPGMDGYTLVSELRAAGSTIPVLMVTAKQLPADKRKGFLAGTDDYMTKPVDTEEMLLRIKALLRRSRIVSERKLSIGTVELDYDALTVTRGDDHQPAAKRVLSALQTALLPG
jgi:DNA-binding response OmpR family regulator